jgi:hypothetical protein
MFNFLKQWLTKPKVVPSKVGIIDNVGTFINLTNQQKKTLELYASQHNMMVEHYPDGITTITFPDNTYFKAFQALCNGFGQSILIITKQSMRN